jgi:hypothetical protein
MTGGGAGAGAGGGGAGAGAGGGATGAGAATCGITGRLGQPLTSSARARTDKTKAAGLRLMCMRFPSEPGAIPEAQFWKI